jgi:hypothetical protein
MLLFRMDVTTVYRGEAMVYRVEATVYRGEATVYRGEATVYRGEATVNRGEATVYRILYCRSDIPYAALQGEDPVPDRSHVLHVSGRGVGLLRGDMELNR